MFYSPKTVGRNPAELLKSIFPKSIRNYEMPFFSFLFLFHTTRCELLMRSAERELAEMERKKLAADAMSASSTRPRSSAELNKERMVELTHQIGLEATRLASVTGVQTCALPILL